MPITSRTFSVSDIDPSYDGSSFNLSLYSDEDGRPRPQDYPDEASYVAAFRAWQAQQADADAAAGLSEPTFRSHAVVPTDEQLAAAQAPADASAGLSGRMSLADMASNFMPMAGTTLGSVVGGTPGAVIGNAAGAGYGALLRHGADIGPALRDIYQNYRGGDPAVRSAMLGGAGAGMAEGAVRVMPGGMSGMDAVEDVRRGNYLSAAAEAGLSALDLAGVSGGGAMGAALREAPRRTLAGLAAGIPAGAVASMGAAEAARMAGLSPDAQRALGIAGGALGGMGAGALAHGSPLNAADETGAVGDVAGARARRLDTTTEAPSDVTPNSLAALAQGEPTPPAVAPRATGTETTAPGVPFEYPANSGAWTPTSVPAVVKSLPAKVGAKLVNALKAVPAAKNTLKHLHPDEIEALFTGNNAEERLTELQYWRERMPKVDDVIGTILGGRTKQGWYENSRKAIELVFGSDADVFTGILAATSPQTSVESNLSNALNIYVNWVKAGRPRDEASIVTVMGRSVQGNKGDASVLNAWRNNTVAAIQEKMNGTLSGPKVDSFWANLRSRPRVLVEGGGMDPRQAATMDAWMSNIFGVVQRAFGSGPKKLEAGNPGMSEGYLAGTALLREAAAKLGISASEAQETAWSWGKALYEKADELSALEGRRVTAREVIEKGLLSEKDILATPDFSSLLQDESLPYARILQSMPGMDPAARLKGLQGVARTIAAPTAIQKQWLLRSADRLDALKAMRDINADLKAGTPRAGSVVAALPMEGRPGMTTGVNPAAWDASMTQKQQDSASGKVLNPLTNAGGRSVMLDAMLPGRVGETRSGTGYYAPEGRPVELNRSAVYPVRVQAGKLPKSARGEGDEGIRINPKQEGAIEMAGRLQGAMTGQKATVHSALAFGTPKQPLLEGEIDAVRMPMNKRMPRDGVAAIVPEVKAALRELGAEGADPDYDLIAHEDGLDLIRVDGKPMLSSERDTVKRVLTTVASRYMDVPKQGFKFADGKNISHDAYQTVPWSKQQGTGAVTQFAMRGYDELSRAQQSALDGRDVKLAAAKLFDYYSTDPNTRQDHLNMLRIISEGGVSALARAMKDPAQVLPALAALGLAPYLASTSTQPQQN
jgi:hypothetical protein